MFWSTNLTVIHATDGTLLSEGFGAVNGLLHLSLDEQLSTIFGCPGNGSKLTCCWTCCCCIPESYFSPFTVFSAVFPFFPLIAL